MASVLHNLSGEPLGVGAPAPGQDRPRDVFTPTSLSTHCRVTAKLKAKIWAHEYFDFGLLLANSPTEPQYHLSVTTSAVSGSAGLPTLCLEPTNKAKPLTSIDAWTSAFQIFVGVYTTKFPQEAPALMKYGEVVRDLAAQGANWRYYDTNFRYLKQQQPASLALNEVHWELWIRSQNLSTTKPPRPSNGGANPVFIPHGYCRKFHRGGACAGCNFKHECHKCHRLHPSSKCNFDGPGNAMMAPNLLSAHQHPEVVDQYIEKELSSGRLAGPFPCSPFPYFRVSPLGVVPKKSPGEFCLVQHLSYSSGASVNDYIPPEHTSVTYARVDDAVRLITRSGVGSFLAKTDIKNAFRIIPIRPEDYHLLGMRWRGLFYYDRCMVMGCASSCKTFESFSSAVEWIARTKLHIPYMIHLLDDVLIVAPTRSLCSSQLSCFLDLCDYLGIPMSPEKTVGPAVVLSFAGIELDTIRSEARLPSDNLLRCVDLLSAFLTRKKVTLQELQSLIGLLNFACSVVLPGQAFLRRLIDSTVGIKRPQHLVRLNSAVKSHLRVWLTFLSDFNGCSFFMHEGWLTSSTLHLYTDASGALGFGAVFGDQWCYGEWPESWKSYNIAVLEFYPIVLSVLLWGHRMKNKRVLFFTDNEALVHVINKNSCRDPLLMSFVRKLVLSCLKHNILFRARHVPGIHNNLADSLSPLQIQRFQQLGPAHMHPTPTVVPPPMQPQNWRM